MKKNLSTRFLFDCIIEEPFFPDNVYIIYKLPSVPKYQESYLLKLANYIEA